MKTDMAADLPCLRSEIVTNLSSQQAYSFKPYGTTWNQQTVRYPQSCTLAEVIGLLITVSLHSWQPCPWTVVQVPVSELLHQVLRLPCQRVRLRRIPKPRGDSTFAIAPPQDCICFCFASLCDFKGGNIPRQPSPCSCPIDKIFRQFAFSIPTEFL